MMFIIIYIMENTQKNSLKVSVFADGENCNLLKYSQDIIHFIITQFATNPILLAYHYWSEIDSSKQEKMQEEGWLCIDIGKQCKNCLDNLLIKNCLKFCKDQMPEIDVIILITCDHDYAPLIKDLQQLDKQVIVIGRQNNINKKLEELATCYYLEELNSR